MPAAEQGRVSIVVASYNHAEFLVRRMDSLVAQTYPDIEILVIDDCSTEDNLEILRRYQGRPGVTVLARESNGGVVAVMNQGIALASGEFIIFAQCDDECGPRMIERLVDSLRRNASAAVAFCRSQLIDGTGRVIGDDYSIRERAFRERCAQDVLIGGAEMARFLMTSCVIPNMSQALFRRSWLAEAGGLSPSYRVCCDWDLYFRLAERHDFAYVAEPLNRFRFHGETVRSLTKNRTLYEEYIRVLLGHIKSLELSARQRARFRIQVMVLWAGLLLSPTLTGIRNFPYHAGQVARHDAAALLYLAPALVWRALQVARILVFGRSGGAAR